MNPQANDLRSPIIASWILLIATCLIAVVPFLGFLAWIIGGVTIIIAMILGVVVIAKGGTWNGIFILVASLLFVPLFVLFAPIATSLITGAALENYNEESIEPAETSATSLETPDTDEGALALPTEEGNSSEVTETVEEEKVNTGSTEESDEPEVQEQLEKNARP
ncbi:MAG: hypothetical protein P1U85_00535 [Verrucomicrobiales bacterium]|nr:hypothetical protein [Verrucomicrobiales bacterium]